MASISCPYCGGSVTTDARYCNHCGTPLTENTSRTQPRRVARGPGRISVWAFFLVLFLVFAAGSAGGYWYVGGQLPPVPGTPLGGSRNSDLNTLPADPPRVNSLTQKSLRSVVAINVWGPQGNASGSGFIVSDTGHVVTNAHVVEGSNVCLSVIDDNGQTHQAALIEKDPNVDVALLSVPSLKGWSTQLEFGVSATLAPPDEVWVLGSHKGAGASQIHRATVSRTNVNTRIDDRPYKGLITMSGAPIYQGTSGGPVVDATTGKVVGIVTAGDQAGLSFAVPADQAAPLIAQWSGLPGNSTCQAAVATHTVPVVLATITPRSGTDGIPGDDVADGVQLALRDMEADLAMVGYEVKLQRYDDQGNSNTGADLARSAAYDDRVIGVVGSLDSEVTRSVAHALQPSGLVMVAPVAGADDLTGYGWKHFHRILAPASQQKSAVIRFAARLGAKSVFLLHDGTDDALAELAVVEQAAKAAGLSVLWKVNVAETAVIKTRLAELQPDTIYYAGRAASALGTIQELRKDGIKTPILGATSLGDPLMAALNGTGPQRVFFTNLTAAPSEAFQKKFDSVMSKPTRGYAAYGYDAAKVILEALRRYGEKNPGKVPPRSELAELVRQTKGYSGWAANVTFGPNGENKTAWIYLYEWENGYPKLQYNMQPEE